VTKIHSAPYPLVLENLRNVLQLEGIAAEVRTPFLGAARGDIPATECWSTLWVPDSDAARAREVIREATDLAEPPGQNWTCRSCGEQIEPQFGACWHCGSARLGGGDA
jgi:hypothetical protein